MLCPDRTYSWPLSLVVILISYRCDTFVSLFTCGEVWYRRIGSEKVGKSLVWGGADSVLI